MMSGPSPSGRVVLSLPLKRYYDPLRLPGGRLPLPGTTGYRQALLPATRSRRGHRGPLQFPRHPSDRSTPHTPEGSLAPAPGSQVPSMAFALRIRARLPLGPAHAGIRNDAAGFASCCGPASCSPPHRGFVAPLRRRALTRRREPCYQGPWRLPRPDSHRLAAVSLPLGYAINLLSSSGALTPELLDAHSPRILRHGISPASSPG